MITGENNNVPEDIKESVDFVLDALTERERTVIREICIREIPIPHFRGNFRNMGNYNGKNLLY